jgi:hypothetical protein
MGLLSKTTTSLAAILGALTLSQAPEFAQQYQQRLGGALDELRIIVADFDRDAEQSGLDRTAALAIYDASEEPFLNSRGQSMRRTIERYDSIAGQSAELGRTPALAKPVVVLAKADTMILGNAWRDFQPAVPITPAGMTWAASGGLLAGGLAAMTGALFKRRRRPRAPIHQLT